MVVMGSTDAKAEGTGSIPVQSLGASSGAPFFIQSGNTS